MKIRRSLVSLAAFATMASLAACAAPESDSDNDAAGSDAAKATSVEDFGGFDDLVKAAQDEGELNVIALPPDWANYGELISTFEDKYDIKVNSAQPDAASQDEINAANQLKGSDRAPDVFDLGQAVALANVDMFAPVPGPDLGRHPGRVQGRGRRLGQRLRRLHVDRLRLLAGARDRDPRRPAEARVQGQGRAQRRPDPGRCRVLRRGDGLDRQRRLGRRHQARRRLLRRAEEGRQLHPRRPDPRDDRVRPDPRRHRLGLQQRRDHQRHRHLGGRGARRGADRGLLLPGDQRRRPAPGRRAAVAGVPLQRRGPEPLAGGRRPADPRRRHGRGGHHRRGALGQPARGHRRARRARPTRSPS